MATKEKLKEAKRLYEIANADQRYVLESLFPELKESEDERIRKELIEQVIYIVPDKNEVDDNGNTLPCYTTRIDKYIAWLEKQGEQNPVVIIPKFRVGDEIKTTNEEPLTITKIDEKGYWSGDLFICNFDDADKWELSGQKPAWSEEDEAVLNALIRSLEGEHIYVSPHLAVECLKSIKYRYTWKPTKDQMEVLAWCKPLFADPKSKGILESLINDLKKLREE